MFTPKHCISTAPYRDRDRHRTQWKSALVSVSVQFVHLHTILHKPVLIIFSVRQCENTRRRIEISTPATNISCWQWWWFHGEGYVYYHPQTKFGARQCFTLVCHSVHRREGVWGVASRETASRGICLGVEGSLPPEEVCIGGLPRGQGWDTMGYDQQAGSTHPTGMLSCFY